MRGLSTCTYHAIIIQGSTDSRWQSQPYIISVLASASRGSTSEKGCGMAHKVSISFNWQGPMDYEQALARVRLAEEAGVDTAWVAEAWGRDCFSILALMARETTRIHLGTGIV